MKKIFSGLFIVIAACFVQSQSVAAAESIAPTMTPDTNPADIHLSAKAIQVINNQNTAMTISNIKITGHESQIQVYASPDAVNSCSNIQSLGANGASCLIWLQAKDTNNVGKESFKLPVSFDYSVDGNKTPQTISNTYSITYENAVYVGGDFTQVNNTTGSLPANRIAKWDGSNWSLLGSLENNGVDNDVHALVTNGLDLYVGGWFTTAGGLNSNRIARWNGKWMPIANGPSGDDNIYVMATVGTTIYAGGDTIGTVKNDSFSPLATMPQLSQIHAMTTQPGINALFVGDSSGGTAAWINGTWSSLASSINDAIFTMAYSDKGYIYIGGTYLSPESFLTKWDGHTLSKLGQGIDGGQYTGVNALTIAGNNLYAAGQFTINAVGANNIAVWDLNLNNWRSLKGGAGDPMSDCVYALASAGDKLYVGGTLSAIKDLKNPVNGIAMWDITNQSWKNIANGVSGGGNTVLALVAAPSITIN